MSEHNGMRPCGAALIAVTATLIAAAVWAQPAAKAGLDACARIQRHRARLNCYDRLARQESHTAQAPAGDAADAGPEQDRASGNGDAGQAGQAAAPAVSAEPAAQPAAPAVNTEPAAKPAAAAVNAEPAAKPAAAAVNAEPAAKPAAVAVSTEPAAKPAAATVSAEPAAKPAPEASPAPAAKAASQRTDFGLSRLADVPSKISVTVVNVQKTYYGGLILTTEDGAVWKQTGTSQPVLAKPPFAATIERGAFDSYFLRPQGHRGAIRVIREQ